MKKILVLGATGAMGRYLVPELIEMGYAVDAVSIDDAVSNHENLKYMKLNALDDAELAEILKNRYDAIVDFLIYKPATKFAARMDMLLSSTDHYIFLSSYRVYANKEVPIRETSPRLLDASENKEFLAEYEQEYGLYKAIGENILNNSNYNNFTIVRPAITYSSFRFQLVTLEAPVVVERMRSGKTVLLPREAKDVEATMSWGGDVAKMIARLVLNPVAMRETYTVSTAEHHTWGEIAEYYKEIGGLKYEWVDEDTFLQVQALGDKFYRWQLEYDRLFDRIVDNSKILAATGMKQSDLISLYDGLRSELSALPPDYEWKPSPINDRMDAYLKEN
ncbi:MAG: NAD-dependent epimerase/dehydratase family protein [Ruminococcaceae bacterium]|nr:NAD-dependent epimerase/dehydratase family protein [Oscillospiraceae bacterium]